MKSFFRYGNPIVEIFIEGKKVEMLLDTGFNGHILLPQMVIKELNLEQIGISDYLTASGEEVITKIYKGKIDFFDKQVDVTILSTDSDFSLAGMELFHECRIIIERYKNIIEIIRSKWFFKKLRSDF